MKKLFGKKKSKKPTVKSPSATKKAVKPTMELKEISYQVVKYLGNFETARMAVTYAVNGKADTDVLFSRAHVEVEKAFDWLYPDYVKPDVSGNPDNYMREMMLKEQEEKKKLLKENYDENEKLIVKVNTDFFHTLKKRILNGSVSIEKAKEFYSISDEVEQELLKK